MAKKDNKDEQEVKNDESAGGKFITILIVLVIVIIWLAIFGVLIKLDVGNFGSEVLYPVLKDVPVVNMILPTPAEKEDGEEKEYDNLAEANARIKELESQLAASKNAGSANSSEVEELQAEGLQLSRPLYMEILQEAAGMVDEFMLTHGGNEHFDTLSYFRSHPHPDVNRWADALAEEPYVLSTSRQHCLSPRSDACVIPFRVR